MSKIIVEVRAKLILDVGSGIDIDKTLEMEYDFKSKTKGVNVGDIEIIDWTTQDIK